jgi:A/G-specific adenine glycosylase
MNFSKTLITWYLENKRDLPWRNTTNPYHIWLSEIMLQQTRVAQGLPYFLAFTETFPTVFDLAKAEEEQVLKLWQGLGYYSRARNLHATAKQVAFMLDGNFPDNYKDLLKLKGIGEYTAAAIASFSYNEKTPVVDGNVYRVLARYFGIKTDIATPKAKKEFTQLAAELIDPENPALFNQSIMEFGALQCIPKNPDCAVCPLNHSCFALSQRKTNELPVKIKKNKVIDRHLNYLLVIDSAQKSTATKRIGKGIWQNLYELPLIETDYPETETEIAFQIRKKYPEAALVTLLDTENVLHKLSHQNLHIRFWKINLKHKLDAGLSHEELISLPFPIVLHNFIKNNKY